MKSIPRIVYYNEKRDNGEVSRIGLIEADYGTHYLMKKGKNTSELILKNEIEEIWKKDSLQAEHTCFVCSYYDTQQCNTCNNNEFWTEIKKTIIKKENEKN